MPDGGRYPDMEEPSTKAYGKPPREPSEGINIPCKVFVTIALMTFAGSVYRGVAQDQGWKVVISGFVIALMLFLIGFVWNTKTKR